MYMHVMDPTLLKIKLLHSDATEETFLSKWFHKEPLTSFCFFVAKEGSSDYKKVKKEMFL